jgi:predicted RND superfamily exporter protein
MILAMLLMLVILLTLQVVLSMQKNKWIGLILPTFYLIFAASASFGNMMYTGEIGPTIIAFVLLSIPAIINYGIYLVCRAKLKEKIQKELENKKI